MCIIQMEILQWANLWLWEGYIPLSKQILARITRESSPHITVQYIVRTYCTTKLMANHSPDMYSDFV